MYVKSLKYESERNYQEILNRQLSIGYKRIVITHYFTILVKYIDSDDFPCLAILERVKDQGRALAIPLDVKQELARIKNAKTVEEILGGSKK